MTIADIDARTWLDAAERDGTSSEEALAIFDRLPAVALDEMMGRWRGGGVATGHPMDGMLEAYGWYGKAFTDVDNVHPLLFRVGSGIVSIDPARLPLSLATRLPFRRSRIAARAFRAGHRALTTRRPTARLRIVTHRGVATAAMVYDSQPIIDLFRQISPDTLLGLMDLRDSPPIFFTLRREC